MERSAGILLPIFSLPSRYGIGSLGAEARAFADFLKTAGQKWWQILPVGPTGAGDSPYTSVSTFAGNPLFIDLELLEKDGLLDAEDLKAAEVTEKDRIDYAALRTGREPLLRKAAGRLLEKDAAAVERFAAETKWVADYALYSAAQTHFGGQPWYNWPDADLRRHEAEAVRLWRQILSEEVRYCTAVQYLFFTQWKSLKDYVNSLGVKFIGDLPIYVSLDSSDVWAEREQFLLDGEGVPTEVAGVPPDYFSAEGQLWGNPLYNWDYMKRDGFGWWIRRVDGAIALFDMIRIDHFRGLESYWAVPATSNTAKVGEWRKGPGMDLLRVLNTWFWQSDVSYIAEDLGTLSPEVHQLREESGLPGMKVLEFAFDGPGNDYLPHRHKRHCICYTGTHDNDTVVGWYTNASDEEKTFVSRYLGASETEAVRRAMLRCGQSSVADLFVAQIQDYLGYGSEARINVPGIAEDNWNWKLLSGKTTPELAEEICELTHTFGRCWKPVEKKEESDKTESV